MKLIDSIWDELISNQEYENGHLTYMEISKNSFETLISEFSQEFSIDDPTIDDLEGYFVLKISVKETDEEFKLL